MRTPQKRHFYWLLLLFAAGSLTLAGCAQVSSVAGQVGIDVPGVATADPSTEPLTASGFIEAEEVSVVAETSGQVDQVLADQADQVTAGDVVVVLDDSLLQADRAQAEAQVAIAQAQLAALLAGPTQQEIDAAQANIDQAQAELDGAQRASGQAWSTASNPEDIDVQIAAARLQITQYQQQVDGIQAQINDKQTELDGVRNDTDHYDPTRIDLLTLTIQQLNAQLAAAQALVAGAQQKLAVLQSQRAQPLAQVAQAHQADSQVAIAQAKLTLAQAQYNVLVADPQPEEIAIAQAQIALAQSQVALIDAQIAQLTLVAPVSGVVTTRSIAVGETASPGVPLMTISNLDTLKLVIYISETQIGRVHVGATVDLAVDVYPNETFTGHVVSIGREAEFTPRNVQTDEERVNLVFAVEVQIPNSAGRLKPGMPCDATIEG